MDELLAWCRESLRKGYSVHVNLLPMSHTVRVWIQADRDSKRRLFLRDELGDKYVGEAPLDEDHPIESLEKAAQALLQQVRGEPRETTNDVSLRQSRLL